MEDWLEQLLKTFVGGELKASALSIGLRALDGIRKLVLIHHLVLVTGVLCALSGFASGYALCVSWAELRESGPPAALIYSVAVFALSGSVLAYSVRSRTWMQAFGLKQQIDAALRDQQAAAQSLAATASAAASAAVTAINPEALALQVAEMVERKLRGGVAPESAAPPDGGSGA